MAVARSPRYPSISLPEAVDKVRMVYKRDHLNKVQKSVVAAHMGYNSLNGKSLGIISAASKYGLLQGNRDSMSVTPLALNIIATEPGSEDRVAAVKQAVRSPALYKEVLDQFPEGVSDQALRSFLLTKKQFLPNAADVFIRGFRETLEYEANELSLVDDQGPIPPQDIGSDAASASQDIDRSPDTAPIDRATMQKSIHALGSGFDIGFLGDSIRISGTINSKTEAEKVIKALTALSVLLPSHTEDM